MKAKKILTQYLTFTKSERVAATILISLIIVGIYLFPYLQAPQQPTVLAPDPIVLSIADSVKKGNTNAYHYPDQHGFSESNSNDQKTDFLTKIPFAFDPNTLDFDGWLLLGLPPKTAKTILNYRSKGGKFYRKEDLQKIWGLPAGFYDHVKHAIQIEESEKKTFFTKTYTGSAPSSITLIDINAADTSDWKALPGIGSKLAWRIIQFREKLGGFHSLDQVGETYGLSDSTFQSIRDRLQWKSANLKKFNINTASKEELRKHPYIKWQLANAIVEYRQQHGPYSSLEQLRKIALIDEVLYEKISPYFTL